MPTETTIAEKRDLVSAKATSASPSCRTSTIYLAGAAGGFLLGFGDLIANDVDAALYKITEALGVLFHTANSADFVWLGLTLVIVVGALACWIHEPRSKMDAFARGLSALALLNLYPGQPPDPDGVADQEVSEVVIEEVNLAAKGHALAPFLVQDRSRITLGIRLTSTRGQSPEPFLVTVRDSRTARVLFRGYYRTIDRIIVRDLPARRVWVELDVPGHRRSKFEAALDVGVFAYRVPIAPSNVPLGVQRIVGYQTVTAEVDHDLQRELAGLPHQ